MFAFSVHAQNFVNGQAARAEFGQYTFTFGGATPGTASTIPNQQILGGLSGLAWANGTLYVADSNRLAALSQDNRVMMFNTGLLPAPTADLTSAKSYSTYQCNVCAFPAFNQLGQPTFTAPQAATSDAPNAFNVGLNNDPAQSNMRTPTAVATDGNVVAVADTDNNRVLIWTSVPTSLNQAANVVLGQADFTHATVYNPPTASSLLAPQGVWIQNGKLYVADTGDNRILIWNSIPTTNNQAATQVLGQANFGTGTQPACAANLTTYTSAANELCDPVSVTSDGSRLYVSDLGFNRVLIWNSIPTANGQNADVVVGQPDMVSAVANNPAVCLNTGQEVQCANNLNFPRYALSDGTRLFVADGGNDRVLVYNTIPTQNGVAADVVLGQPNFGVDNVSSASISIASTAVDTTSAVDITPSPTSLAFDGVNLYVSDPIDNRVLVFTPGNSLLPDSSVVNWASEIIRQEGVVSITTPNVTANDTVAVTLGTNTYTYTVQKNDTPDTIAQRLVTLINANSGDVNAIALFAGTGTGALYLSSKGINLGFDTVAFSATSSNSANETATASGNGYLTAGNAGTGAAGMLVEINGTNLSDVSPSHPAVATLTGLIPTSLGGAQVFMDGVATPVFSASSKQVVAQIPFILDGRNSTSVYVRTTHSDGSVSISNATPVYLAAANPGLFDAPSTPGEARPWPATGAYHQSGNPQAVVDVTGTVNAGDILTIQIAGTRNYTYTVQASDSLTGIVLGLVNAINSGNDSQVTAQAGGAFNRVVVVARQSGAAGNNIGVTASSSSGAKITLTAYTNATCCDVVAGSPITATNPAAPGETITLAGTGLGVVADINNTIIANVPVGQPYTQAQPNSAYSSVSATMGSTTAQVVSAGFAPGSYGTYQVQLIVPQGQATNATTPVYIAQNAFISNTVTIPVGPANSNPNITPVGSTPITINIDEPGRQSSALNGSSLVAGWVVGKDAAISTVSVSVDGSPVGTANYGGSRTDVCQVYPSDASCANGNANVGFDYVLDTTQFADGTHTLQITATDASGNRLTKSGSFVSSNYSGTNATLIGIDTPGTSTAPFQGLVNFRGWAINASSVIGSVTYSIDGVPHGTLTYGVSRPDVCVVYAASPSCTGGTANVGWSYLFDTGSLANGNHILSVSATALNGQHTIQARGFNVANWTTANPIIFGTGNPNAQSPPLTGTQTIGGWAIDPVSVIDSVAIAVDGVPLGNASYGGSRTDVCAVYPNSPGCPNVGWSFSLNTTLLADGSHNLAVTVIPRSGQGFTQIIPFRVANMGLTSNPTLISIDNPNSGSGPFNGFAALNGWALNGSSAITTVKVLVDGNLQGVAVYGGGRSDVCARFGNSPGCPNVGWNYLLNTSALANGTHSLDVTTTAANGEQATASSSFTVSNTPGPSPTTVSISEPTAQSSPYQGMAQIAGTAVSSSAALRSISVSVDGYPYGQATYNPAPANVTANWTYLLNTTEFADGPHVIAIAATAADGSYSIATVSLQIANWTTPSPTRISIDRPSSQSAPFSGQASFGGWALNPTSTITAISIAIDTVPFGNAFIGGNRSDVCQFYSNSPGCPNVGWNFEVDTTLIANGTHTLSVTATSATGQTTTNSSSFIVAN